MLKKWNFPPHSIFRLLFDVDQMLNSFVFTVAGDSNKLLEAVDEVEEEVVFVVDVVEVVVFVVVEVEVFVGVEDRHEVVVEVVLGVEGDLKKQHDVLLISLF